MKNFIKNLIKYLGTKDAIFFATIFALIPMINHTAIVYQAAYDNEGWILSYVYSIALELAILLFVLRGRNKKKKFDYKPIFFMLVSIGVNACYYFNIPIWVDKLLLTIILPVTIALYSYEVVNDRKKIIVRRRPRKVT